MTFKVKKSGAFANPSAVKRKSAGAFVDVGFVKAKESGVWVQVWPFYGVSIDPQYVFADGGTSAAATVIYRVGADGSIYQKLGTGAYTSLESWIDLGTNTLYEVRFTQMATNGNGTFTGTLGSWIATTSDNNIQLVNSTATTTATRTIRVEIRLISTGTILDTADIDLEAERF